MTTPSLHPLTRPEMNDSVRDVWFARLNADIPPEDKVRRRNAAITATYAALYKKHPETLKWAGCAAFASHRVGLALRPYDLLTDLDGTVVGVEELFDYDGTKDEFVRDVEMLRRTNNHVFADIGWALLAYSAPDGGLEQVRAGLVGDPNGPAMLEGFEGIDEGRRRLARNPGDAAARDLIWRGNEALLSREQKVVVQPAMSELRETFRLFLSVATDMDFDADHLHVDVKTHTSFWTYMVTLGLPVLARSLSVPDFANFEQRWTWVKNRVFPIWRSVDESDATLERKIGTLIAQGRLAAPTAPST